MGELRVCFHWGCVLHWDRGWLDITQLATKKTIQAMVLLPEVLVIDFLLNGVATRKGTLSEESGVSWCALWGG